MNLDAIARFAEQATPFYLYDIDLLRNTLKACHDASTALGYKVHYALKANSNLPILMEILDVGFGADCVSGNEVQRALESGFPAADIVLAGVGKSDQELALAIGQGIYALNVESLMELEVIEQIAISLGKKARIALRINPNVDAFTHKYITTGLEENKFGINPHEFEQVLEIDRGCPHIELSGLHFHIGSQITDLTPFRKLCFKANEIHAWFANRGVMFDHVNLGGGMGVDYLNPDRNPIPDFQAFFDMFAKNLDLPNHLSVHFELGRALVAQCGSLISKVLYIKKGINTQFVILDAGMTELIRPALYQSYHRIENISALTDPDRKHPMRYDVVGPICESSDCFGKAVDLPETKRGDLIAIRSTGAYGETMSSEYNLRSKAKVFYFPDFRT